MRELLSLCMTLLFFSACAPAADPADTSSGARLPVTSTDDPALPSELSIAALAAMPLTGTGYTLGDPVATTDAYTRYSIRYRSNGLLISGILNLPFGNGPFPLAVLNHGYIAPSVYTNGRGLKREQDALARAGFAVLHSDYRGHAFSDPSPDTERRAYDAGLEYAMDVVNGIHALCSALPDRVDCNHISMLGHSMGGGVTLNIAVAFPDLVDHIALYAPVHARAWENFVRWHTQRDEDDRTAEVLGTPETNPDGWAALSSWTFLTRIQAPVRIYQGTEDADVPPEWSRELEGRLRVLGKEVTLIEYDGEAHEFINRWPGFIADVAEFFGGT